MDEGLEKLEKLEASVEVDATQTSGHADQHLEEQVSLGVAMGFFPDVPYGRVLECVHTAVHSSTSSYY